jgi:hypothetical protein
MLVSEETKFTLTLDAQLRDAFMAEAAAEGLTISQVAEALIRQYLAQRRQSRDDEALFQQRLVASSLSMIPLPQYVWKGGSTRLLRGCSSSLNLARRAARLALVSTWRTRITGWFTNSMKA